MPTELAELWEDNLLDFLDSTNDQWGWMQSWFPMIKVKPKEFVYSINDMEHKLDKLEGMRILMRTQNYQLSRSEDGKEFDNLGYTGEWYPWKKNVFFYDNTDQTFETMKTLEEARDRFKTMKGADTKMDLKRMDIIYLLHPERGILKMYLKLSQSCGYSRVDGETIYHLDKPMEGTYRDICKLKQMAHRLWTIEHALYNPDETKNDQLHYPKFIEETSRPIDTKELTGYIQQIMNAIEESDINRQKKLISADGLEQEALEEQEEAKALPTDKLREKAKKNAGEDDDLPF